MSMARQCDRCGKICGKVAFKTSITPVSFFGNNEVCRPEKYNNIGISANYDLCDECYTDFVEWMSDDIDVMGV